MVAMRNDHVVPHMTEARIAAIARAWREEAGFGRHWNFDIVAFVEEVLAKRYTSKGDLEIVLLDGDHPSGKKAWVEYKPKLKLIVRREIWLAAERGGAFERFVIAHEIGHVLLHNHDAKPFSYEPGCRNRWCEDERSAEWQANQFAYHFLLPDELVKEHAELDPLVEFCGVTREVAEARLASIQDAERRSIRVRNASFEDCPWCLRRGITTTAHQRVCTECGLTIATS